MKSTQEKRLFKRIVFFTFLLGLVSGPYGWLIGTKAWYFIQAGFDPLTTRSLDWPLEDLQTILNGALWLLVPTVLDLCSPFLTGPQWKQNRRTLIQFSLYFLRISGAVLVSSGCLSLFEKPLKFPSLLVLVVDIISIALFPIGACFLSWYLLARDKRRIAQRESAEAALHVEGSHEAL